MPDVDVIVIGSGFGGAVCSARLAEAGYRVEVLERGKRWTAAEFPRKPGDQWTWDDQRPVSKHGWFDFKVFPHMTVVQGAGVGGGSLVYANISVDAKPDSFHSGWPAEITFDTLAPHYARVAETMAVKKVPANQWPERTRLLRDAAVKLGFGNRFRQLDLAVMFDEDWTYEQDDPFNPAKSKPVTNAQGQAQGTCVHLGECDLGCPVRARNTLDLNYLAIAERHGAAIRPLHIVRRIAPIDQGYEVTFVEIAHGTLVPGTISARLVIVAAGSLGSTHLLLQGREAGDLPDVSDRLGHRWSSNGDFLTPALHFGRRVMPTRGPTITAAVDLLDGAFQGQAVFIEDGGLPDIAEAELRRFSEREGIDDRERALIATVRLLFASGALRHVMPWFAQSRDAADGRLSLRDGKLFLDWDIKRSKSTIDAVVELHQRMATATDGLPLTPMTWTMSHDLITPHPLGGCNMASSATEGVVDHRGEVFGYPNLFVADGAVVPEALGLNPSKTIAALAEHIAEQIVREQR